MSSIIVNGWIMPSGCIQCPFFSGQGCRVTMTLFQDWLNVATRPSECPLEEWIVPIKNNVDDLNEAENDKF